MMKMKSLNIAVLLSFLLVFGIGEFCAQPRYAKMSDTVFHVWDLIQYRYEQRFSLDTPLNSNAQRAGIDDYSSQRVATFSDC